MDQPIPLQAFILSRPEDRPDWLMPLVEERLALHAEPLLLVAWDDDIAWSCRRIRDEHGGAPLGVILPDETGVPIALEAGADEAIVLAELSRRSALAFLDRVFLRARLRREQERSRASVVHSEKLVALGTLVAGVAHEVNNPLTALLLSAEGIKLRLAPLCSAMSALDELVHTRRAVSRDDLIRILQNGQAGVRAVESRELLAEIESSAQMIARVVRDLKLFARPDEDAVPELIDVQALLEQVLRIVGRQIRAHALIETDYEPDLPPLVAPSSRLAQVITNILLNASHAIGEIQRPIHRIRIVARADSEAVAISISDTGPGIPPHVVGRIFDPFFTTKREGVGSGLGLSISRSILRRLGGDLLVDSMHGEGTTFVAIVPLPERGVLRRAQHRISAPMHSQYRGGPRQRVLIVDPDERVLKAIALAIDTEYDVLLARDSQEAIEQLSSGSRIDAILADVSRPECFGLAIKEWLGRERSSLLFRFVQMVADEDPTRDAGFRTGEPVLTKPISRSAVLAALDDLLRDLVSATA